MSLLSPALTGRFFTTSATWEAPGDRYRGFIILLFLLLYIFENSHKKQFDKREDVRSSVPSLPGCGFVLTDANGLNRLLLLQT